MRRNSCKINLINISSYLKRRTSLRLFDTLFKDERTVSRRNINGGEHRTCCIHSIYARISVLPSTKTTSKSKDQYVRERPSRCSNAAIGILTGILQASQKLSDASSDTESQRTVTDSSSPASISLKEMSLISPRYRSMVIDLARFAFSLDSKLIVWLVL